MINNKNNCKEKKGNNAQTMVYTMVEHETIR